VYKRQRLYTVLRIDGAARWLVYEDGQWWEFLGAAEALVYPDRLLETADGDLYHLTSRQIWRWTGDHWKPVYELDATIDGAFVDPVHGVHVIADDHVYHHPYRPR
jgi:hypothetical protein